MLLGREAQRSQQRQRKFQQAPRPHGRGHDVEPIGRERQDAPLAAAWLTRVRVASMAAPSPAGSHQRRGPPPDAQTAAATVRAPSPTRATHASPTRDSEAAR